MNFKTLLSLVTLLGLSFHGLALAAYQDDVDALNPTHYWTFDNTLDDRGNSAFRTGVGSPAVVFEGAGSFGTPITADSTNSLSSGTGGATVSGTSQVDDMNLGADNFTTVSFSTWFQSNDLSSPTVIYEQGGGTNNFAFIVGVARNVQFQAADEGCYYLTKFADTLVEQGKPYHLFATWERGTATVSGNTTVRLWINGIEQSPNVDIDSTCTHAFPSHIGDINWGNNNDALKFYNNDTLTYVDRDKQLAHFAIWNDVLLTDPQIQILFENGAAPTTSTLNLVNVPTDTSISLHEVDALGGNLVSETTSAVRDPGGNVGLAYPVTTYVPSRVRLVKYGFKTFETDVTLDRFANTVPFFVATDDNITEANATTVRAYATIDDLNELYDRSRAYDEDTPGNGFDALTVSGDVIDVGAYNVIIDPTAPAAFDLDTGGNTITIRTSALNNSSQFSRLRTTGTITLQNGASLGTALLEDSTGTTGVLTLTDVIAANVLLYDDAAPADDTLSYQTAVTGDIVIPFNATASTDYQVVVRRAGFSEVNFEFDPSGGGEFEFPIRQFRSLTIEGTPIYSASEDITKVTMDFPGLRVNVGDFTIGVQELYDTLQAYEVTEAGMKAPRIANYDGNDKLLLLNSYQLRNRDGGGTVPGVNGFLFAETGTVLDSSNGSVQFLVNASATVDRQEQIIRMLEEIQGSTWDNNGEVYATPNANLSDITGLTFDVNTDSLSNLIQSMLNEGLLNVNTAKDLFQ